MEAGPGPDDRARSHRALRRLNWPFGPPHPEVFYDPRTAHAKPTVSLHAKCVVADGEHCLVGSANFTDRGQSRNYEAGALLVDRTFAGRLTGQWWSLVAAGKLLPWAM